MRWCFNDSIPCLIRFLLFGGCFGAVQRRFDILPAFLDALGALFLLAGKTRIFRVFRLAPDFNFFGIMSIEWTAN